MCITNNNLTGEHNKFEVILHWDMLEIFRKKLHEGVIRDIERQQRRKAENLYNLQQQIDLTKQLQNQNQYNRKDNVT